MKKARNKMRTRLRGRQKFSKKTIIIYSTCSAVALFFLVMFFNMANVSRLKAKEIDIRLAEEQVFRNDMSIPSPEIKFEKATGPNTIFIRKIKPINTSSEPNHE